MSGENDSKAWIAAPIIFGILLAWLFSKYIIIPWCRNINRRRPYDKLAVDPKAHTIDVETQGLVEEEEFNDDGLIYDDEEAEQEEDSIMHTKSVQYSSRELEQLKLLDKAIEEAEEDTAASASQRSGSENQTIRVVSLDQPRNLSTIDNSAAVKLSDDRSPLNATDGRQSSPNNATNESQSQSQSLNVAQSIPKSAAATVASVAKKIKNSIPLKSKIISGQNMGAINISDSDDENRPLTVDSDANRESHLSDTVNASASAVITQLIPDPPSQKAPTPP